MKLAFLMGFAGILSSTLAFAEPVEERQALMKSNGQALGLLGATVKGERAFDAEAVLAALEQINANAEKLDVEVHFPEGSGGGESRAAPVIWEDWTGFVEAVARYKEAAAAGVAAAPTSVEALQSQVGAIGQTCSNCHETYRLPSS